LSKVNFNPRVQPPLVLACILTSLLSACAGTHTEILGMDYRPAIIQKDVDLVQYEKDRALCERQTRQKATNYEPTNIVMFRQCLSDRGYKLMS